MHKRYTLISWMMTLVMVSALFFSGFHQHDDRDGVLLEQACQICVAAKHVGLGVLPGELLVLPVSLFSQFVSVDVTEPFLFLQFDASAQPRAPPAV